MPTQVRRTPEELYGKEKLCTKCKNILPLNQFAGRGKQGPWLQSHCRLCQRRVVDERKEAIKADPVLRELNRKSSLKSLRERQNRLHDIVIELKSKPCMDCGGVFHPCAMDFDHREGEEKTDCVARLIAQCRPIEDILAEIEKCDLVCANCHRIRTYKRTQLSKEVI